MKKVAVLFICLAAFMWSVCGILIKFLNRLGFTAEEMTFVKITLSLVIVVIIIKVLRHKIERIKSPKDLVLFFLSGSIGYLMYGFLYAKSVNYIPISAAVVLVYTAPAIVMVASVFLFKEAFTKRKFLCLVLVFVGCVFVEELLVEPIDTISHVGILLGLLSGASYAMNTLCNKILLKKYSVYSVCFYNFLFAIFVAFTLTDTSVITGKIMNSGFKAFILLLIFAISSGSAAQLLYIKALDYLEVGKAAIITSIEPLLASILGIIIFKENINVLKIIGLMMILTALFLINKNDETEEEKIEEEDAVTLKG